MHVGHAEVAKWCHSLHLDLLSFGENLHMVYLIITQEVQMEAVTLFRNICMAYMHNLVWGPLKSMKKYEVIIIIMYAYTRDGAFTSSKYRQEKKFCKTLQSI